jgi:hypothetical protein
LPVFLSQHVIVAEAQLRLAPMPLAVPPAGWGTERTLWDGERLGAWCEGDDPFDAIIAPRHALVAPSAASLPVFLEGLWPLLQPAGKVIFSAPVSIGSEAVAGRLRFPNPPSAAEVEWPQPLRGFRLIQPVRLMATAAAIERDRDQVINGRHIARNVDGPPDGRLIKAVFAFERIEDR